MQNVTSDQPDFPPVDFWHSLRYFNLYRLTLASFFVFLAGAFSSSLSLSPENWMTFFITSVLYATVAAFSFVPLKLHWPRFNLQLAGQIVTDIIALNMLAYINEGMRNSVGLLLMVSLAAAGLISRGKITLFFAALTSIAALLEHTYEVLHGDADASQYIQVGLLCIAYFAVAWLAHTMARRI